MKTDVDTLLITLYVVLDDRILPALGLSREHHPGWKPRVNGVELICSRWRGICSGSLRNEDGSASVVVLRLVRFVLLARRGRVRRVCRWPCRSVVR